MCKKILPAIRNKWPQVASKTIFIQQDNDLGFREAATLEGFGFHLVQQPPNSPDINKTKLVRKEDSLSI